MAFGIGSAIKRAGRRFGNQAERSWGQVEATAARAERGRLFGNNVYARYVANITGATTTARLVRRAREHEDISPGDVVDDAAVMRPSRGYSDAMNAPVKQAEKEAVAQQAEYARIQAAQEAADRNAQGVLIRRRRNRADPTKGGTLLTGALGLTGGGSRTGTQLGVV
jgi:hypothetical protein